ncbi:MAG: pyrrolysine--tRNA(Pyl) ligase large subunit [Anaerovoracaceae bacterium]|jgi:pyrrolysyl-tRNA synthetase-like protein
MSVTFTLTQKQRLSELNADEKTLCKTFNNNEERDTFYKEEETRLVRRNREDLQDLLQNRHLPLLSLVEKRIAEWLTTKMGFTQVNTPIIIPKTMLDKMGITSNHPLRQQVFWIDNNKCLRPMLAPNLYEMMKSIHRITRKPVRIFEMGPCFRKESQGAQHLNEFTMLNLVEFAEEYSDGQMNRLKELASGVMSAVGITDYELEITTSEVYGETLDIVKDQIELGSGAYGPHPLDSQWGIFDTTWTGIGFGMERIAMVLGGYSGIKRVGRNLTFLDGCRLNI